MYSEESTKRLSRLRRPRKKRSSRGWNAKEPKNKSWRKKKGKLNLKSNKLQKRPKEKHKVYLKNQKKTI